MFKDKNKKKISTNATKYIPEQVIVKKYSESLPEDYKNFIEGRSLKSMCFEDNYILHTENILLFITFKDFYNFGLVGYLLYDFETKKVYTKNVKLPFPYGKIRLPKDFRDGYSYFTTNNLYISCDIKNDKRAIRVYDSRFKTRFGYNIPFNIEFFVSPEVNKSNYDIYNVQSHKKNNENYFLLSRTIFKEETKGHISLLGQLETFDNNSASSFINIKRANYNFRYNSLFYKSKDLTLEIYDSKLINNKSNTELTSNIYIGSDKYQFNNIKIKAVSSDNNRTLYIVSNEENTVNLLAVPLQKKKLNAYPYSTKKEKYFFCEISGLIKIDKKNIEIEDKMAILRIE